MGHACQILTFETEDKKKIQARCDEWANANCDPWEHGGRYNCGGLGYINYTSKVFDSYNEACAYLESTFGNYRQTAVQYRQYPNRKDSKKETALKEKVKKTWETYDALANKVHYKDVTSKYIACSKCGSKFSTEYCGKTWGNVCPICRADLRPKTTLDRIASLKKSWEDAKVALNEEVKKENDKNKKNSKLCWAVACEVHC